MSHKRVRLIGFALGLPALAAVVSPALAQGQSADSFFKKAGHLTMVVGSGAGGGYDQIARLVARNIARFLPGHPKIVVQNMPGAGGVVATNWLYNAAPKDGSTFLADTNSSLALPIYNSPLTHYDPRKFAWIGSIGKQQAICVTWKTSGVKTLQDAMKHVVTVSATATNAGPGIYPVLLNKMLGTKFKVVSGYDTPGMRLAVQRGEVQGLCGFALQTYEAIGSPWFKDHDVNVIAQMGLHKNPQLPNVPLVRSLLKNKADRQVFDLIVLPQEFGRPFLAPPGTPPDRVAVYRKALKAMLKDKQFLAEAKKQRVALEPLGGRKIEALLDKAYAAPKAVRDRASLFEGVKQ
ncbi:MAG TPA: tripartite tricarboxylate transporter substrate-binding protein [Beijerinckiaceae bacterium]|nr:tripartite tricarboxylate transporter substrate-binding protein [Beijerinckiaceae bacterium]